MKICIFFFCLVFISVAAPAQQAPLSSDSIIREAVFKASQENKNVFIIFHASWCGWCHKMDKSMNDTVCKKFFDDNYVIRHLVVMESKDKKNLENPGAFQLLRQFKGEGQGIPYWLVFDRKGDLLADSQIRPEGAGLNVKGDNSGCPATKEEVSYFISVLRKTSSITDEQLKIIEKRFRENEN